MNPTDLPARQSSVRRGTALSFLLALLAVGVLAQAASGFHMARIAGEEVASDYGRWELHVSTPVTQTGIPVTVPVPNPEVVLPGGLTLAPLAAGTPLRVGAAGSADSEVIVPTAVAPCAGDAAVACLTATFTFAHPAGLALTSASGGLQEAINSSHAGGGGTVLITPDWPGTPADILAVTLDSDVLLELAAGGAQTWYGLRAGRVTALATVGPGAAGLGAVSLRAASIEQVLYADRYCATSGVLDQSCVQGALTGLGSGPGTLFVPAGQYAIGSDLTIPSSVTLQFARGAMWAVAAPHVVQINGPVIAGNAQIFATTLPSSAFGAMTSGSSSLELSRATWSSADVGAPVYVAGAAATSNTILYADPLAGAGDGTTATFAFHAQHVPLAPASVAVIAGTAWGIDNGSGTVVAGADSAAAVSGTVDYATGAIAATFAVPPAPGTIIELGYQTQSHLPQVGTITQVVSSTEAAVSFSAAQALSGAQVFYGGSYVKFGPGFIGALNPAWWGAVGDGSTDATAALQAAMIACGESQYPLRVPSGTYVVNATLDPGDPFQLGIYSGSGQVGGQCSILGQPGGTVGGAREPVVFQAANGFPAGHFILQRENAGGVVWRDFEVDGHGTGANGIDGAWWETLSGGSPATSNEIINVNVFNFGRLAFDLDNWNDAVIREDTAAQATGAAPISFQINAGGGKLDLYGVRAYNGAARITAQNANLNGGGFYDGLQLISQGANSVVLTGVQIFPNAATGIAIESTSSSAEGSEYLSCDACWLTAGSGQSFIAGKWGIGSSYINTTFYATSGAPNIFGPISGPLGPRFYFEGADLRNGAVLNSPALGQVYSFNQFGAAAGWQSTGPFQFSAMGAGNNAGALFVQCVGAAQGPFCIHAGTDQNLHLGSQAGRLQIEAINDAFTAPEPLAFQASSFTFQTGAVHFASGASVSFDGGGTLPDGQTLSILGTLGGTGAFDLSQAGSLLLPGSYSTGGKSIAQPAASGTLALASQLPVSASSAPFSPGALAAGACATQPVTSIAGVTDTMAAEISPQADPGAGIAWQALIRPGGVAVRECNLTSTALTPAATAFNIRVLP